MIYEAHRQAPAYVVGCAEQCVFTSRSGETGVVQEENRGVVGAAFDHWDSRAGDPQLHTHVVVMNRAQSKDGVWRKLDSRGMFRATVGLSEMYNGVLSDFLTQGLGWGWEPTMRLHSKVPTYEVVVVPQKLRAQLGCGLKPQASGLAAVGVDAKRACCPFTVVKGCVSVDLMARRWFSVRVELLGGRAEQLWPYPGRLFAVGPAHTFADLARAIDTAFARWDLSHLSLFTLADGRVVTDGETGAELATSAFGVVPTAALDIEVAKVMQTVEQGAQFRYVFDLGDDWTHCCTVDTGHIDPEEVLGVIPPAPMAYWGWGTIPDQYDRQWAEDDGEGSAPPRPRQAHAMLDGGWPESGERPPLVDVGQLRVAAASGDVAGILAALQGHDVSEVLQRAGSAVQVALRDAPERVSSLAISLVQRLEVRNLPGDEELAQDLLAAVRRESPPGRPLPVDLEELSGLLEGDLVGNDGGFLDLWTAEVLPAFMIDEAMVGEDEAIDVDAEPDRWLRVPCEGSRAGWEDMADYIAVVADSRLREQLGRAIEGKGGFRRFRDLIGEEGLTQAWQDFSDERQIGRARQFLAELGIRATT